MYTAIPFIIKAINNFSEKYETMSFLYGYDHFLRQHLINVEPFSDYNSEEYLSDEADFISEFIKSFPEENVLFVSNDEYIKVNDPIHYAKKGSIRYFSQIQFEDIKFENISASFDDMLSVPSSLIETLQDIEFGKTIDFCDLKASDFLWEESSFAGENTYAMAA